MHPINLKIFLRTLQLENLFQESSPSLLQPLSSTDARLHGSFEVYVWRSCFTCKVLQLSEVQSSHPTIASKICSSAKLLILLSRCSLLGSLPLFQFMLNPDQFLQGCDIEAIAKTVNWCYFLIKVLSFNLSS